MHVIRVKKHKKYVIIDPVSGKPSLTTNILLAHKFNSDQAASNYIKNCIPNAARKRYETVPVEEESPVIDEELIAKLSQPSQIEEDDDYDDADSEGECNLGVELDLDVDWEYIINKYAEIVKLVESYNNYCKKKMKEMDHKRVVDIHHFIEFNDLNGVNGFKIYKFTQDQLRLRRKLKDTLAVTDTILSDLFVTGDPETSLEVLESQRTREYHPRIFKDLFENGISAIDTY